MYQKWAKPCEIFARIFAACNEWPDFCWNSKSKPSPSVEKTKSAKLPRRQPSIRGQKLCLVFGCDSGSISHPQFNYFKIPKRNLQQAKVWVNALRICPGDLDGVVCSKVIRGCIIIIFKIALEKRLGNHHVRH